jgi:hypothetical protein
VYNLSFGRALRLTTPSYAYSHPRLLSSGTQQVVWLHMQVGQLHSPAASRSGSSATLIIRLLTVARRIDTLTANLHLLSSTLTPPFVVYSYDPLRFSVAVPGASHSTCPHHNTISTSFSLHFEFIRAILHCGSTVSVSFTTARTVHIVRGVGRPNT